jgi:lipopolysaccharide transport system ATP-binding protein
LGFIKKELFIGYNMTHINLKNVNIDFPVYSSTGRSIKHQLIQVATGGKIRSSPKGKTIIKALDSISLDLREGDRVGIIGHNGSGKSTLLRTISGVYSPTTGSVDVFGGVGSLIDISLGIDTEATGIENIYLRGAYLGLTKAEIDKKRNEIINFSELGEFINMPIRTYSTGMQMRLAFSIATTQIHEILIMDEWLSVGDEAFSRKAETKMNEILDNTKIMVLASHSRDLILKTCNRVIWLEHGKLVMDGGVEEVVKKYFGH